MSAEVTTLKFEQDDPCNTTLCEHGEIVHIVAMDFSNKSKPVTRVHISVGMLVTEWVWRSWRSDLLTLDGKSFAASSGLKKSIVLSDDSVSFEDDQRRKYHWRNSPALQLQLFSQDDKTRPIARSRRSRRDKSTSATYHPSGTVARRARKRNPRACRHVIPPP